LNRLILGKCISIGLLIVALALNVVFDRMCFAEEMNDENTLTISKEDNGKIIAVRYGDLIRVELEMMGGAGYGWYIDNLNTEYMELLKEETKVIADTKTGAPVMKVWLFQTKKKGTVQIKMEHYRIWEGKDKSTEHFSVTLAIE
jgi:predicted secreted protein